jgi:hypothetical protein
MASIDPQENMADLLPIAAVNNSSVSLEEPLEPDMDDLLAQLAFGEPPAAPPTEPRWYGMETRIKALYEGPSKCPCCINWVEEYPDDVGPKAEALEDAERCAVVMRYKKSHGNSLKTLELDSIVIQSPVLRKMLAEVFEGYPGMMFASKRVVLEAPFAPLFHRWDKLCQLRDSLDSKAEDSKLEDTDREIQEHLKFL